MVEMAVTIAKNRLSAVVRVVAVVVIVTGVIVDGLFSADLGGGLQAIVRPFLQRLPARGGAAEDEFSHELAPLRAVWTRANASQWAVAHGAYVSGLREAARITPWYHEDDICWIAECEICEVPMVVWRHHGTEPPGDRKSTRLNSSHRT